MISVEVGLDFRVRVGVRVRVRLRIRLRDRDWVISDAQTTQLADHMISSPLPEELPTSEHLQSFNLVIIIINVMFLLYYERKVKS